jgi:hypothetical protein
MNYYLARYLGLDQPTTWLNSQGRPMSEALVLAYFATRVDYDGETHPVSGGLAARSRLHFPDAEDGHGVRIGDRRVQAAVRDVARAGDLEMFGILTHVFQDTFAHQGYGDLWGHARAQGGPYTPDEPFRHAWRDEWMARATYEEMRQLLLARRGVNGEDPVAVQGLLQGRNFDEFWNRIRPTLLVDQLGDGKGFARVRVANWQERISRDLRGARPRFSDTNPEPGNMMAWWCRRLARAVPNWYDPNYRHAVQWAPWGPGGAHDRPPQTGPGGRRPVPGQPLP